MPIQNKEELQKSEYIDYSKEKPKDVVEAITNLKTNVYETIEKTEENFILAEKISLLPEENQEKIIWIMNNYINLDKVA